MHIFQAGARPRPSQPLRYHRAMLIRYLGLPILIAVVGVIYWWTSDGEPAGSAPCC